LRHIRHPNMVLFFGACVDPLQHELALVYELLDGLVLQNYVINHLTEESAPALRKILQDICCALCYLHTNRPAIAHGDLKGSNVMVVTRATQPVAKLLDFGLSQVLSKNAKLIGGTKSWTAPELLLRRQHVPSPSTDIFSYGHIIHLVATGLPRPAAPKKENGRTSIANLQWPQTSLFQKEAPPLCDQCMRYNPRLRPNAESIQKNLSEWLVMGGITLSTKTAQALSWYEGLPAVRNQVAALRTGKRRDTPLHVSVRPTMRSMPSEKSIREQLCVPSFLPTRAETKAASLIMMLSSWNIVVPGGSCCMYHAVIDDALNCLQEMKGQVCRSFEYSAAWQCSGCGALCADFVQECGVCGESKVERGANTTTLTQERNCRLHF